VGLGRKNKCGCIGGNPTVKKITKGKCLTHQRCWVSSTGVRERGGKVQGHQEPRPDCPLKGGKEEPEMNGLKIRILAVVWKGGGGLGGARRRQTQWG